MILLQARILEFKIYSQINLKHTLKKLHLNKLPVVYTTIIILIGNLNSGHNLNEALFFYCKKISS